MTNLCLPHLLVNLLLPSETSESVGEVPVQVDAVMVEPEIDGDKLLITWYRLTPGAQLLTQQQGLI